MGSQTHTAAAQCIEHALQVTLKGVQIQQQRWGFDVRDGVTQRCGRPWAHSPIPFKARKSINFDPGRVWLCTDMNQTPISSGKFYGLNLADGRDPIGQARIKASVAL
jgi:hypothetical protein